MIPAFKLITLFKESTPSDEFVNPLKKYNEYRNNKGKE